MGIRFTLTAPHWPTEAAIVYGFETSRIVLGRWLNADVCIPDACVEHRHAQIQQKHGHWSIEDADTLNGLRLNGQKIPSRCEKKLKSGDIIEVGAYRISVQCGAPVPEACTHERSQISACQIARWSQPDAALFSTIEWTPTDSEITETFTFDRSGLRRVYVSDTKWLEFVSDVTGVRVNTSATTDLFQCSRKAYKEKWLHHNDEIVYEGLKVIYQDPAFETIRSIEHSPAQKYVPPPDITPSIGVSAEQRYEGIGPMGLKQVPTTGPATMNTTIRSVQPETLVYVLAMVVFALSLAGLVVMMKSM